MKLRKAANETLGSIQRIVDINEYMGVGNLLKALGLTAIVGGVIVACNDPLEQTTPEVSNTSILQENTGQTLDLSSGKITIPSPESK